MRYALVDDVLTLPSPGLAGICRGCGSRLIARCGRRRVHHWAHYGERHCDSWWEPETDWHVAWKNRFPTAWQEIIAHDAETGEKHIADVYTAHGMTLEFQHSRLDPAEREARERFHTNLVWVVDATRLKNDLKRFVENADLMSRLQDWLFVVRDPRQCFPRDWLESSVPVFFDFRGTNDEAPNDSVHQLLWCLLPGRAAGQAVVAAISRNAFVTAASQKSSIFAAAEIVAAVEEHLRLLAYRQQLAATRYVVVPRYGYAPKRFRSGRNKFRRF